MLQKVEGLVKSCDAFQKKKQSNRKGLVGEIVSTYLRTIQQTIA